MMDGLSIKVEVIAGESPWQMGKRSKHLNIVEEMVRDAMIEDPELSMEEAIEMSCSVKCE